MHNIGANQVEIRQDQQYMRSTMDRVQQDVRHSFEYLFAGLEQVHPGYFSNPPSFPYGAPGDQPGSSGQHHDDDQ